MEEELAEVNIEYIGPHMDVKQSIDTDEVLGLINEVFPNNEVVTNTSWKDGRKIYRQVVEFGALPSTATKDVSFPTNVLSADFDRLTGLRAMWLTTTATPTQHFINNLTNVAGTQVLWSVYTGGTDCKVRCNTIGDFSADSGSVLVEYTRLDK